MESLCYGIGFCLPFWVLGLNYFGFLKIIVSFSYIRHRKYNAIRNEKGSLFKWSSTFGTPLNSDLLLSPSWTICHSSQFKVVLCTLFALIILGIILTDMLSLILYQTNIPIVKWCTLIPLTLYCIIGFFKHGPIVSRYRFYIKCRMAGLFGSKHRFEYRNKKKDVSALMGNIPRKRYPLFIPEPDCIDDLPYPWFQLRKEERLKNALIEAQNALKQLEILNKEYNKEENRPKKKEKNDELTLQLTMTQSKSINVKIYYNEEFIKSVLWDTPDAAFINLLEYGKEWEESIQTK